jgi:anthranilate synthase component 1
MLVDLARNDLSRNGHTVTVDKYREVQFSPMWFIWFPESPDIYMKSQHHASGRRYFSSWNIKWSQKHRAMQLIEEYEKTNRNFMEVP